MASASGTLSPYPRRRWATGAVAQAAIIFTVAFAAHISFYGSTAAFVWPDTLRYAILADGFPRRIATLQWDNKTPPGYPFFLWLCGQWISTADGVALVQQLLAATTPLLVWWAVRKVCGTRAATVAALAVALSPNRHYYAQALLRETLTEWFLAGAVCLLVSARDAPMRRMVALRGMAGLAVGATVLMRTNLLPAMILATLTPPQYSPNDRRGTRFAAAVLATALGWLCLMAPWQVFNYQINARGTHRPAAGRPGRDTALPLHRLLPITRFEDYRAAGTWAYLRNDPIAYGLHAGAAARALLIPFPPRGDVAPGVCKCQCQFLRSPLPGFVQLGPCTSLGWRRTIHRVVCSLYKLVMSIAWLGLIGWFAAMITHRRFDNALLAAVPLACVAGVAMMLQNNTRYAFPCEALALGFGLPAAHSLLPWVRQLWPKH